MEVYAAKNMWGHSVEKNGMRYSKMLCDGDSKSHKSVNEIYPVCKEKMINHMSKTSIHLDECLT